MPRYRLDQLDLADDIKFETDGVAASVNLPLRTWASLDSLRPGHALLIQISLKYLGRQKQMV